MLSANWITKVITIPQSDLTLVSGTEYSLEVSQYAQLLRELNGSAQGILHTVLSPLFLNILSTSGTPQVVNVINGYTVQFENLPYSVDFLNGNTNYRDVEIKNTVSVGTNNVSGFNTVSVGSAVTAQDMIDMANLNRDVMMSTISQDATPIGGVRNSDPDAS